MASGITPVPCTPAYVVGIVSVRGEIVTLLDLAAMLGLGTAAVIDNAEPRPVLLLGLPGLRSGLVVDEVVLVPSGTVARTTSGKVRRLATKTMYESSLWSLNVE